jgi:hypothetical protein
LNEHLDHLDDERSESFVRSEPGPNGSASAGMAEAGQRGPAQLGVPKHLEKADEVLLECLLFSGRALDERTSNDLVARASLGTLEH